MIVAVTPSIGVTWSLPSRRGRSYPSAAASAIRAWSRSLSIVRRAATSTLAIRNVVVAVWAGASLPASS